MTHPSQDYGFTPGTYAIYVRIRTNGLGNYPHRARFGIYNSDTKIEKAKIINDLTTSYQLRYVMNYTVDEININEREGVILMKQFIPRSTMLIMLNLEKLIKSFSILYYLLILNHD